MYFGVGIQKVKTLPVAPDDSGHAFAHTNLKDAAGTDPQVGARHRVEFLYPILHAGQVEVEGTDREIDRHDLADILSDVIGRAVDGHQLDHEFRALLD